MQRGSDVLVQRAVAVNDGVILVQLEGADTDKVGKLTNLFVTVRCSQILTITSLFS